MDVLFLFFSFFFCQVAGHMEIPDFIWLATYNRLRFSGGRMSVQGPFPTINLSQLAFQ